MEDILTVFQASKYCRVSPKTIINWIDASHIEAYRTVGGHRLTAVCPRDYLFARATKAHITDVFARGRRVVAGGEVLGVEAAVLEETLRSAFRETLASKKELIAAWPAIESAIAAHDKGCC